MKFAHFRFRIYFRCGYYVTFGTTYVKYISVKCAPVVLGLPDGSKIVLEHNEMVSCYKKEHDGARQNAKVMTSLKIQPGFISAQFFTVLMVSIDSKHPIKPISEDRQIPNRLKNEPGWASLNVMEKRRNVWVVI